MQQWLLMNKKADFKAIGEKFQIDQVTARIIRIVSLSRMRIFEDFLVEE